MQTVGIFFVIYGETLSTVHGETRLNLKLK
jgi:hypothetical protein